MNKIIVGNLKSSLNESNVKNYVDKINKYKYDNLIICVDDKYIDLFKSNNYNIAYQDINNINLNNNVKYALLGHYSVRNLQTDEIINKKINYCLSHNLKVILCIGNEKKEEFKSIINQIDNCLKDIKPDEIKNIILAYEPFYMINSNLNVDIKLVKKYIDDIKSHVKNKYNFDVNVLYGGNVNELNINKILEISDGILVGRLCFDVNKFTQILHSLGLLQIK